MLLIEVNNKKSGTDFLNVPRLIYRQDPFWVCPLDNELEAIFNPEENNYFSYGEAIRWVLKSDEGHLIGRVAAFINRRKAYNFKQPTGCLGFFECINDKKAAFVLFDKCREWLQERGMQAMDGPVNFGENDTHWGLLVEGFTQPAFGMNYHLPYYRDLFESYGFHNYFEQISHHLDITKPFPERFWRIAERVRSSPEYSFRHFLLAETERFIGDMKKIHDEAWKMHENFKPIDENVVRKGIHKARPFLDEKMIWFVYHKDEPAAFFVMLPDVNQILKYFNGKMNLINKLRFLYLKSRKTITRTRVTILGVKPKYQHHGLESGIFWHLNEHMKLLPQYKELEISWVGDYNPKMKSLLVNLGGYPAKRHITYRKLFHDQIPFQRSTIIPSAL